MFIFPIFLPAVLPVISWYISIKMASANTIPAMLFQLFNIRLKYSDLTTLSLNSTCALSKPVTPWL